MESKVKYAAIQGSLGKVVDRFMSCGYNDDITFTEVMETLGQMEELDAISICHARSGEASDAELTKELLAKSGKKAGYVHCHLFNEKIWADCSLSSRSYEVRKEAIECTKKTMDYAAAIGAPGVNLWLGQDGFDYPLCTEYKEQWNNLVESTKILAEYNPSLRLTLEGKIREPRNRSLVDTAETALLMALETGCENVGVAIDNGHVLQSGQNIAQNIEIVAKYGKLFGMHVNDNYGSWDDDMIFGSVRFIELLEMFYALRAVGYDGTLDVDIFPYRENQFEATRECILNMKQFDTLIDVIGWEELTKLRQEGDPCKMTKTIREKVFAAVKS